jgi:very-short-patch-repair endonuclease
VADGLSYTRAKAMRQAMTPPEARLWNALRAGRLNRLKFRRQHPVGPYILDFYCADARLAVEVDGEAHDHPDRLAHDERRTRWLAERGIDILRVVAADVRDEADGVVAGIRTAARERLKAAAPPPGR